MSDLFGNPDRLETAEASATAVDLFTATAERIAYEGDRNVSQVRVELTHGTLGHAVQSCVTCGSSFLAKPRTPATCNLCRAKVVG